MPPSLGCHFVPAAGRDQCPVLVEGAAKVAAGVQLLGAGVDRRRAALPRPAREVAPAQVVEARLGVRLWAAHAGDPGAGRDVVARRPGVRRRGQLERAGDSDGIGVEGEATAHG